MPTIIYLVKVSIILTVLFGVYVLLFKKHSLGDHKRAYLLAGLLIALILPILPMTLQVEVSTPWQTSPAAQISPGAFDPAPVATTHVPDVTTQSPSPSETSSAMHALQQVVSWQVATMIIWLCGVFLFLSRLILNMGRIHFLYVRGKKVENAPTPVRYHPKMATCSSFFDYIFWDKPTYHEDQALILQHEILHKKLWHSADILFSEMIKAFLWFLPTIYFWKKEIILNHEYTVDQILAGQDKSNYLDVLSRKYSVQKDALALQFASLIKQRVDRINQKKSRHNAGWTYIISIPLVLGLYVLFASHAEPGSLGIKKEYPASFVLAIGHQTFEMSYAGAHSIFGLSTALDISRTKDEILDMAGKDIRLLYNGRQIMFTNNILLGIRYEDITHEEQVNSLKIKYNNAQKIYIENASDQETMKIVLRDQEKKIIVLLNCKINDPDSRTTYIPINEQKYLLPAMSSFSYDAPRFDHLIGRPVSLFKNGKRLNVIREKIELITKKGFKSYSRDDGSVHDNILGAVHEFTLADDSRSHFVYYVDGDAQDTITYSTHAQFLADASEPAFHFADNLFSTKVLETQIQFKWGEMVDIRTYESTEEKTKDYRINSSFVSLKDARKMLEKSPLFTPIQTEKPSIFVDVEHIRRQDLPMSFSLIYDTKTGNIKDSKQIVRYLARELKNGDQLAFSKVRTQYSDSTGINFRISISDENAKKQEKSENENGKIISIEEYFALENI